MGGRLAVLGWHNVSSTPFFPCAPGAAALGLERQLRALRRGARVVPLERALEALAAGRPLPRRAVALTFDDGYRDNLDLALPILDRLGLPATFYLVPGLLDRAVRPWWELVAWAFARARATSLEWRGRLLPVGDGPEGHAASWEVAEALKGMDAPAREAALDRLIAELRPRGSADQVGALFLDWDGARRLAARAAVGSHTVGHPILSQESPEAQAGELDGSRRRLEAELGREVRTLAYPNGTVRDYHAVTLAAAGRAGYRFALTTRAGWNDAGTPPLEVRRFVLDPVRGLGGLRPVARTPGALGFARGA